MSTPEQRAARYQKAWAKFLSIPWDDRSSMAAHLCGQISEMAKRDAITTDELLASLEAAIEHALTT